MTDELENLRPEVRAALEVIAGEAICTCHEAYTSRGMKDPACNHDLAEYVATIRAELLRLAALEREAKNGITDTVIENALQAFFCHDDETGAFHWRDAVGEAQPQINSMRAALATAALALAEQRSDLATQAWPQCAWIGQRGALVRAEDDE